ncbi:MAG TPA: Lrp/AsnC family transcriptional regulator [Burkholderiaceae bacterium]
MKNAAMDRIDREIVSVLTKDGRISYRELGEQVCLSANAAAERVKVLVSQGIIQRFSAKVDPAAVGLPLQAYVEIKLAPEATASKFEADIQNIPGIVGATLLTGNSDYMLRLACRDQQDFVRIMENLRVGHGVQDTQSRLVLREFDLGL